MSRASLADGPARPREMGAAVLHRYGRRTDQPEVSAPVRALRGGADAAIPETGGRGCSAPPGSLALHLLAGGNVALADGGGRAVVSPSAGRGLILGWNAGAFTASVETIPLTDPAFTRVWGPAIHRLVLTARRPATEGEYTLTVRPNSRRV
ncbi:hypothetical protein [Streptomyces antimycoticus]|uniref:hypothetical protein n=1 Tax=Streptomyces antimycoticus TaxID=68175 RepID=UPI0015821EB0|nr:hypothetical protein [Streptomyces antimycoticus]